jgi:hypothetical protein
MEHQRLPSLLLAAILAALLWFGLAGMGSAPPPLDASAGRVDEAQLAELLRRIEGLERRLDRAELHAAAGAPQPLVESPGAEVGDRRTAEGTQSETMAIRAELAKLWRALENRSVASGTVGSPASDGSVSPSVIRAARTDYAAIAMFLDQKDRDSEAARQELLMADQAEILRRFGRPWQIETGGEGYRSWYYCDEQDQRGFWVQFLDGFVNDI